MNDLTIIYYSANVVPKYFERTVQEQLEKAAQGTQIISVTHKPVGIGDNIIVNLPRHHLSIYRQALLGAKQADTKYIAMAEDDVLYSVEHFKKRPSPGKFAYNMGSWNIYTWSYPLFTHKGGGRKNLNGLICERELFIEAMEERFAKWPVDEDINLSNWAEPGKYEKNLGVTVRPTEEFYVNPPNIVFSHDKELSFGNLGTKKRLGEFRATEIPYWGKASDVLDIYKEEL